MRLCNSNDLTKEDATDLITTKESDIKNEA